MSSGIEQAEKNTLLSPQPESQSPSPASSTTSETSTAMFKGADLTITKRKALWAFTLLILAAAGLTTTVVILVRRRGGGSSNAQATPETPVSPPSPKLTDPPVAVPTAPTTPTTPITAPPASTTAPSVPPESVIEETSAPIPPTESPTSSSAPSGAPTVDDFADPKINDLPFTRYYAIGDAPYTPEEAVDLNEQMRDIPSDAEFVIHIGDIRSAADGRPCTAEEFNYVANILKLSQAPVFIVIGDNEWNDCPNIDQAKAMWHDIYESFEDNWDHKFKVIRQENHRENFAFVNRGSLYIGVNVVGGLVHNRDEWDRRHFDTVQWIKELVNFYRSYRRENEGEDIISVQIFAHANPHPDKHADFFGPLTDYMKNDLKNEIPFLYLNGDQHVFRHQDNFADQGNFLRVQVEGGTHQPPLQFTIPNRRPRGSAAPLDVIFYDRQL